MSDSKKKADDERTRSPPSADAPCPTTTKPIVNPFENPTIGILKTFAAYRDALLNGEDSREWRKDKFRDETPEGFTIDTCVGFDTGLWETGVQKPDGEWIIVAQYKTRDEAEAGHKEWIVKLCNDPKMKLPKDIFDFWNEEE